MLFDPENLDFRMSDDSPAKGYGCETYYIPRAEEKTLPAVYTRVLEGRRAVLEGDLKENTQVKADILEINSDLTIHEGVHLDITPGTTVVFNGNYRIDVFGTFSARGTPDERILFTVSEPPADPDDFSDTASSWRGINFNNTLSTNEGSKFEYCIFEYSMSHDLNFSYPPAYTGGVFFVQNFSKLHIENSIFRHNRATYGSVISLFNNANPVINNNLIYENYAYTNGAAAYILNSYPRIYNNTVINNRIVEIDPFEHTATFYAFRSKPLVVNNVIRDNFIGDDQIDGSGQVYFGKIYFIHNNNMTGIFDNGYNSNGNIDKDPYFDPDGEFPGMITDSSPCVNAGTDMGLIQPQFDLLGNARVVGTIDIGAFEDQTGSGIEQNVLPSGSLVIYPNPANPSAELVFYSPADGNLTDIHIYDIRGSLVEKIHYGVSASGRNTHHLLLNNYAAGIYFVRVFSPSFTATGKLLIVK